MSLSTLETPLREHHIGGWAREVLPGAAVAATTLIFAVVTAIASDVPLRDPSHVTLNRLTTTAGLLLIFGIGDALWRARRDATSVRRAVVTRWTPRRAGVTLASILTFYLTYFAYRNVKSVVPVLLPHANFDKALTDMDADLTGTGGPAKALHDLLGTGASAHVLSDVYMFFFAFIPIVVAAALVFSRETRTGVFVVTALSLNWTLGAASYLILPSLGPFAFAPAAFAKLPHTAVTDLQVRLMAERAAFLRDPQVPGLAQSIGAFASLHVAIWATVAFATVWLRAHISIRIVVWLLALGTVLATVYFGWHYIADDVAGVLIAAASLALAWLLVRPRTAPVT